MKQISVVIPCYNQGQYLEETVESVLNQTYQNFEIVIVNDGSTDQFTIDLLKEFDKPQCRIIHTDNQGLPAARNRGIHETEGEYVCCLDADDKYDSEYFSKAIDIFSKDKELRYGAVAAWVQLFGNDNILWKTIGHNTEGFKPFFQGVRNNLHSSTMFRRICWTRIGGYDETMTSGYEDWDFWIKMLSLNYEYFCLEEPLIYYRQKNHSMVTEAHKKRVELLERLINNNYGFYQKNMLSIIQELDNEVFLLKDENKRLSNELSIYKSNDCTAKDKIMTTNLKGNIKIFLAKLLGRIWNTKL